MRLATFNILHGRSLDDGRVDVDRLGAACASLDADVLGLQEVDRDQERSGGVDLTAAVAEATGAVASRFEPALIGTPGAWWRPAVPADREDTVGGAAYGVALLSRLPVRRWHVVRLPGPRARWPIFVPGSGRVLWVQDEPRIGLAAEVETDAGVVTVATTHLSFVPGWNLRQLRRLVRALALLPGPMVLLGDLNTFGRIPAAVSGWRPLVAVKTYPMRKPSAQLDHVLARGALPAVTGARAVELPLSDHRALVVDFADATAHLPPTQPVPR